MIARNESKETDGDGVCIVNWIWEENMVEWIGGRSRGLEVDLRAFYCRARGGGGRLRHATGKMKKEKKQEKVRLLFVLVVQAVKAKAVAVESACLHCCSVLVRSLSLLNIVKYCILTNTPDCAKTDCKDSRLLNHN